jgi:hypothetical protein
MPKKTTKPVSLDQLLKEGRIQCDPEITDWMKKLQTDPALQQELVSVRASADRAMKEMLGEVLTELEDNLDSLTGSIAIIRTYFLKQRCYDAPKSRTATPRESAPIAAKPTSNTSSSSPRKTRKSKNP